jgi:uncharacterized membrane protein YccF (DUF307 family)
MKTLGNILWFALAGVWLALGWLFWAAVLAITVVGLPSARQCVKLAWFSLWPFGRVALPDPTATKLGGIGAVLWFIPGFHGLRRLVQPPVASRHHHHQRRLHHADRPLPSDQPGL